MFKGHPKGLFVIFFSNMGERFGYYTMLSIFILYLEAKLGLSIEHLGFVWSGFLFSVYFLPLLGGILADKVGYGRVITTGILLMFAGYSLLAIPGSAEWFIYISLLVIALGTGLFKSNLIVILGNLYETPAFKNLQDSAFNIYYMGINVGAFFAPYAAISIRNFILAKNGFTYNANLPGMAHQFINGTLESDKLEKFQTLAQQQLHTAAPDLMTFSNNYVHALSTAYNAGFGIAACSMIISLIIFFTFKKHYKHADYIKTKSMQATEGTMLTAKQTKDRMMALILVFFVVIFFWMGFHQNGYTFTLFAKNYTAGTVGRLTGIFFDLPGFLSLIGTIIGIVLVLGKKNSSLTRTIGGLLIPVGAAIVYWRVTSFSDVNAISPELFQSFNPIFVVFLTPVIITFFAYLGRINKEPSSPKKIGIGMLMAAASFGIMVIASRGLVDPELLKRGGGVSSVLVSPYWLISTYLSLTVAELFLSPMGLSFVARVSPPQYRGMMQGGWMAATAIGNTLSGLIGAFYAKWELWQFFLLLVCTSLLSAIFIFSIMKKLEKATN